MRTLNLLPAAVKPTTAPAEPTTAELMASAAALIAETRDFLAWDAAFAARTAEIEAADFEDVDLDDDLPEDQEGPDGIDHAYRLGYSLAREGIAAACPRDASPGERLAFLHGTEEGALAWLLLVWDDRRAAEAEVEAELRELDRAEAEATRGDPLVTWHEDEIRQAGQGHLPTWAIDGRLR